MSLGWHMASVNGAISEYPYCVRVAASPSNSTPLRYQPSLGLCLSSVALISTLQP